MDIKDNNFVNHMRHFGAPWYLLGGLLLLSLWGFHVLWTRLAAYIIIVVFIGLICWKPMNIIYGLIGTRGKIEHFLGLIIVSISFFSLTYYFGFFKDAGITYDVNQPHLEFSMFKGQPSCVIDSVVRNSGRGELISQVDSLDDINEKRLQLFTENLEEYHYYQRIDLSTVVRNTILTTLMQEPSDFCANAGTYVRFGDKYSKYKSDMQNYRINIAQAKLFHWLLLFQIFISWIFLGVFISIIYKKFRNE